MNSVRVLFALLSHHVREMERITLRSGMESAWLNTEWQQSETALAEVKDWFENLDTDFGREEVEDTANFTRLLTEANEAEDFLTSVNPIKEDDPDLAIGIDYLERLTRLANLRLRAIASSDSHASVVPTWA